MEEVPEHVHLGPIFFDVLSRQHEHRSGLIWRGDHETVNNTAGCTGTVGFRDRLYKVKKELLEAWILRAFTGSETDDDLICALFIWLPYYDRPLVPSDLWRAEVPLICYEIVEYHYPGHVMLQFARAQMVPDACDTRLPTGVDRRMITSMLQEVDDMASVVIQEPPSSPSQMAVFAKKMQTIIRRCMVSIGGGGHLPVPSAPERHEHVYPNHVEVERGEGSGSEQPTVDPFDNPNLDIPSFSLGLTPASQSLHSGSGTSQMPPLSGLGFASFQAPHSTSYGFLAGSSTSHQPISQASSPDEEERADDMDGVQHYGFGHRVVKKTVKFTPSD
ncbi:hypothetical protein M9H77_35691 [Catharanthus roseus]|uniref:Uncharacterized protein n=1 Tax=Catharanthus roseus TaxID=4058 RepID=A0ACB9ZPQ2_CATRO|nr:hypothetical protein M9H77_35691 [Catharanthus roseus]